jgi:PKD repeat protein
MNMNRSIFSAALVLITVFTGCKKEEPPAAPAGDPVFTFTGMINGSPVSLSAGRNDYYMFTSYTLDMNGAYEFTGELKNKYCTSGCTNSLKISVIDYRQYSPTPTDIDTSLAVGNYAFATPAGGSTRYMTSFNSQLANGTVQNNSWDFGDGITASTSSASINHIYTHPGMYMVTLTTTSTTSCISSISNLVKVGQVGPYINALFTPTPVSGNQVNFSEGPSGGTAPYTLSWNFGDGNTSTLSNPTNTYPAAGVYLGSLTATDALGVTDTHFLNIPTVSTTNCSASFFSPSNTPLPNGLNLADVIIEWRDASGTLYTSYNNSQSASAKFKVSAVTAYSVNENGQPVTKIQAKISCLLFNGSNSIQLDNANIVFAVSHL